MSFLLISFAWAVVWVTIFQTDFYRVCEWY